jgi:hypothetical protein
MVADIEITFGLFKVIGLILMMIGGLWLIGKLIDWVFQFKN